MGVARAGVAAAMVGVVGLAFGQGASVPAISMERGVTFFAGQMKLEPGDGRFTKTVVHVTSAIAGDDGTALVDMISNYYPPTGGKAFVCPTAYKLNKGDVLAARVSAIQSWTVKEVRLCVRDHTVMCPAVGLIQKFVDSHSFVLQTVSPAVVKSRIEIKPGKAIHLDGYAIEATRLVRVGETIPVICINGSMLSVEVAGAAKGATDQRPFLLVFQDGNSHAERISEIKLWQTVSDYLSSK